MDKHTQADKLCTVVSQTRDMSNATARIAAWMVGAANATGGFPIELSYRQVKEGFTKEGKDVPGTGSRTETIKAAFDWLEEKGYLTVIEGSAIGFGHSSRLYRLEL
jgi:hypothetical protein